MPVPPRPSSQSAPPSVHPEGEPSREESQTRRLHASDASLVEPEPEALAGTLSVNVSFDDEEEAAPPQGAIPPIRPAAGAPPPEARPHAEGDVIAGKYRLIRIIGRGGMGAVWLAHNIPLDIDIAIKLIRRDRTGAEAAGRLLQEARAVAQLKHPSIVRVFDFGESERGDPFIAMELLNGESLSAIIHRKRRISPTIAVQTLLPVASALASAHAKGIVHRDLKPDNILLAADEMGSVIPKLVDFGIAKVLSADVDRQVTMAGEVLGSPDYMSPEQARGAENVREATDIWTFSILLYEAITGRRPFDGPNYNALIAAILTNDPVPLADHGVNEPQLWAILQRGLAKSPEARWPSMRDFGAQLAAWVVERGVEDDVAGNPIHRQWLTATGKRLITVFPDGPGSVPSGVRPAAGIPADAPAPAGSSPSIPVLSAPPLVLPWEVAERRPRQALWIAIGGAIVAILAIVLLVSESFRDPSPDPAASSAAPSPPAPSPPPSPQPSAAETPSSQPTPASVPSTSASAKAQPAGKTPHGKARQIPQVPGKISF